MIEYLSLHVKQGQTLIAPQHINARIHLLRSLIYYTIGVAVTSSSTQQLVSVVSVVFCVQPVTFYQTFKKGL